MADVRIGGAYVDWQARNAQFLSAARRNGEALRRQEAAVRRLRRTVRDFNSQATEMVRRFTSIRSAAVALAGAGGIGLVVRRTVASAASIEDLARQAGVGVEQFQELTHAARAYGVSQDALVDGLKELNLRVDEFVQTGAGSAEESLRRLGFTSAELEGGLRDASLLFDEVIRRVQLLDTAARIRVADELFGGTAGEQFVRIVEAGAEGVAEMRRQAQELGLVFDSDVLGQTRELQRQIDVIEAQFGAQLNRAIIENAGAIQELGNQVVALVPQVAQFADSIVRGFGYLVNNAPTILTVIAGIRGAVAGSALRVLGPIPGLAGAIGGGGLAAAGVGEVLRQLELASLTSEEIADRIESLQRELDGIVGRGAGRGMTRVASLRAAISELEALQSAARALAPTSPPEPSSASVAPRGRSSSELLFADFGNPLHFINPQIAFGVSNITRLRDVALEVTPQIELTTDRLEEWPLAVERTSLAMDSVLRLSGGIGASVGSFVSDLTTGVDSLADSISNLAREILALLRTELIARPIAEGIQGFLLGNPGFLGLGGIGRAQVGGLHRGLTLVGEQGPELVNLGQTSRVFDARTTAGALAGGDTINLGGVHVTGADAGFVEQVVSARVLPSIRAEIAAAIAESRRRG